MDWVGWDIYTALTSHKGVMRTKYATLEAETSNWCYCLPSFDIHPLQNSSSPVIWFLSLALYTKDLCCLIQCLSSRVWLGFRLPHTVRAMWRTWWRNSASAQTNGVHIHSLILIKDPFNFFLFSSPLFQIANNKLNISSFGLERGINDFTLYQIRNHPTWKNRIVLADTPGFQDVTISEYSALKAIRDWIKASYVSSVIWGKACIGLSS